MADEKSETFVLVETVNPSSDSAINKDGFLGVDPVYQNYADNTGKPLAAGSGDNKKLEQRAKDRLDGKGSVPNVQLAAIRSGETASPVVVDTSGDAKEEKSSEAPSDSK